VIYFTYLNAARIFHTPTMTAFFMPAVVRGIFNIASQSMILLKRTAVLLDHLHTKLRWMPK
jgi:hypothetical protein